MEKRPDEEHRVSQTCKRACVYVEMATCIHAYVRSHAHVQQRSLIICHSVRTALRRCSWIWAKPLESTIASKRRDDFDISLPTSLHISYQNLRTLDNVSICLHCDNVIIMYLFLPWYYLLVWSYLSFSNLIDAYIATETAMYIIIRNLQCMRCSGQHLVTHKMPFISHVCWHSLLLQGCTMKRLKRNPNCSAESQWLGCTDTQRERLCKSLQFQISSLE